MNKYLKESIKYLLRSYPVIYPYVKEVERMYNINSSLNFPGPKRPWQ